MQHSSGDHAQKTLARSVGIALILMLAIGISASVFISSDLNINMTADVAGTASNMLEAEERLRAKAWFSVLGFGFETFIAIGLFVLLQRFGLVLAAWSLALSLVAALATFLGAIFAMNAAQIAGNAAYAEMEGEAMRFALTSLQVTSDYTSFHLALVVGSVAKAGYFYLFLRSGLIPVILSAWGIFASLFVASMIVARDFIPALGANSITMAFILSNLMATVLLALYLAIRGVRTG